MEVFEFLFLEHLGDLRLWPGFGSCSHLIRNFQCALKKWHTIYIFFAYINDELQCFLLRREGTNTNDIICIGLEKGAAIHCFGVVDSTVL
jgi:hypothetical protein